MCEGAALLGACAFAVKVLIHVLLFVLVRAAVPRYRYDQLMNIGWKTLLPLSLALLLLEAVALIIFS